MTNANASTAMDISPEAAAVLMMEQAEQRRKARAQERARRKREQAERAAEEWAAQLVHNGEGSVNVHTLGAEDAARDCYHVAFDRRGDEVLRLSKHEPVRLVRERGMRERVAAILDGDHEGAALAGYDAFVPVRVPCGGPEADPHADRDEEAPEAEYYAELRKREEAGVFDTWRAAKRTPGGAGVVDVDQMGDERATCAPDHLRELAELMQEPPS